MTGGKKTVGRKRRIAVDAGGRPLATGRLRLRRVCSLKFLSNRHSRLMAAFRWQRSTHPDAFRSKIDTIHDGVDAASLRPNPNVRFTPPDGLARQIGLTRHLSAAQRATMAGILMLC